MNSLNDKMLHRAVFFFFNFKPNQAFSRITNFRIKMIPHSNVTPARVKPSRTRTTSLILIFTFASLCLSASARQLEVTNVQDAGNLILFDGKKVAPIFVDTNSNEAVLRAVEDLARDFARVTGNKAEIKKQISPDTKGRIIIGTLGKSKLIDQLSAQGKLDANGIRGQWESYVLQIVTNPLPNINRALVIAGSDRRGTIYGTYQLSKMIGVSPWYWWADVPVAKKETLALSGDIIKQGPPGVKYRGFFINDEDWGLNPWAKKTFDPQFGNIGPKTYAKVFELMLRLRLNYLWPAMHPCSTEFGSVPENAELADKFGIVIGSSHCEPMLYNNVHWNERTQGKWNYFLNRDAIHGIWEKTAKDRSQYEAVWTLGIRGIHDRGMETPPDGMADKINLMEEIFHDQRELLDQNVTRQWGPIAQCFIPYKEVLPIYDAGLKVPDDVALVWVDDNFGYIRRLSNPAERKRSGGAGVYWHLSYYGSPHSYTWINSTAPALMWEELHKAWENDARTLWVINVGDIKPMEIGIDYFSRLAWNPDGFRLGGQRAFLQDFAARNFGEQFAQPLTDLMMKFYKLGTIRKPELMDRTWAISLAPERAAQLREDYRNLLNREKSLFAKMPASSHDAYTELVGFPVHVIGDAGLIFMNDRQAQESNNITANENEIAQLRNDLEGQVKNYNTKIAGGKWNHIMPGLVTGRNLMAWNSQVRWPWGEKTTESVNKSAAPDQPLAGQGWRDAATADHQTSSGSARWAIVEGLGPSGRAMALEPAELESSWSVNDTNAPTLEYDFTCKGGVANVFVDFLPTFRIYPGLKLRVAVSVDDRASMLIEVPGSSGAENENGTIRRSAVQDNYTRSQISLTDLSSGKHRFKIRAVDPGAVIDAVSLP
jgi:hypothetical protein